MSHLHGMNQLLLCVKHELDAAVCASPQLLDDKVLIDKHVALQDVRAPASTCVQCVSSALHADYAQC